VHRNVAALARQPKLVSKEGRALSPEEARKLLATLEGRRTEALFITILALGLRRGEVLGLQWSDVDLESAVLTVNRTLQRQGGKLVFGSTKTPKSRRPINLPDQLVTVLKAHKAQQAEERLKSDTWQDFGLVFTSNIGTPIDPRNLTREFSAVTEAAGIGHWRLHDLRHSAACQPSRNSLLLTFLRHVIPCPAVT
jgi:integrase